MKTLTFTYDQIPESVNKLYSVRFGRKVLSAAGRKYKNTFLLKRGGIPEEKFLEFEALPHEPYTLTLIFYLKKERLYNQTFGKDKRVKSPFNDIDTSNLIKLFEDCLSELTGIRDKNNFSVLSHKRESKNGDEYVFVNFGPLSLSDEVSTP